VHDLPRQLTGEELAELFEGHTRLVELLAQREDPLGAADEVVAELTEAEQREALNTHPASEPATSRSAPQPSRAEGAIPPF